MPRTIFVEILTNGEVEIYDENMDFIRKFDNSTQYRKWIVSDCQDCTRRRFNIKEKEKNDKSI